MYAWGITAFYYPEINISQKLPALLYMVKELQPYFLVVCCFCGWLKFNQDQHKPFCGKWRFTFGPPVCILLFSWQYYLCSFIYGSGLYSVLKFCQNQGHCFWENHFAFCSQSEGPCFFFEVRMFIFIGYSPIMINFKILIYNTFSHILHTWESKKEMEEHITKHIPVMLGAHNSFSFFTLHLGKLRTSRI
jgi:hypothetical protein